jgi:hypothetical protein
MITLLFIRSHYGSANVPEISWTLVAVVGSVICLALIRMRMDTMRALYQHREQISPLDFEIQETLAQSHIQNEAGRLAKHGIAGIIGVVAMFTQPANPDVPVSDLSIIIALGLIAISCITVWQSWKDWRTNVVLLDKARREEDDRVGRRQQLVH